VTRLLAIMGSGETAPTMIKPHRAIFSALGDDPLPAVLLDTPYGFQANADDISAKAIDYFSASVGRRVVVASLRDASGDAVSRASSLAAIASARWVFAGPGSPTYALRQWAGTEVPNLLRDKLEHGGAIVFASAAALTLGRRTVPVYEIYKVGAEPLWRDGLDLLDFLGPDVAVIPHYDNAEGGHHDTRFCYLGEHRLSMLEEQMSAEGWVLGVDEHTGCVFDLDAMTVTVVGNGTVTVRRRGKSSVLEAGTQLSVTSLIEMARSSSGVAPAPVAAGALVAVSSAPTALHQEIRDLEASFDQAISAGDVDAAVRAMLALDDTLVAWSGDTTQSDAGPRGRAALRRMISRLGELARTGARDPESVVGGFVSALLAERSAARADKRYADSDRIRDALTACGVEVRDTPDGTEWSLSPPEAG
jgi:hypothetical protein